MNRKAFYDLETTGVGRGALGSLTDPVGVYSVGYQLGNNKPVGMFGKTDLPMEEGAEHIAKMPSNARGLAATKMTETEMLKEFVSNLKKDGVDELVGFNIHNYDSPLLVKRLRHLGLSHEADYVNSIKHTDVMHMVKSKMDHALSGYKGKIDWNFGDEMSKGLSLEAIARGLGISTDTAHAAATDVSLTRKVYDIVNNGDEFVRRFNAANWAKEVDVRSVSAKRRQYKQPDIYTHGDAPIDPDAYRAVMSSESMHSQVMQAQAQGGVGPRDSYTTASAPSRLAGNDLPLLGGDWGSQDTVKDQAVRLADTHGISINEATDIVKSNLNKGKDEILKGMGDVVRKGKSAGDFMPTKQVAAVVGGLIGGAWLLDKVSSDDTPLDDTDFISAALLGSNRREIMELVQETDGIHHMNKVVGERAAFGSMKAGRAVHNQIEHEFSSSSDFVGAEVAVSDKYLGVKGFVDIVTNVNGQDVPIEVKTVDDARIDELQGPTEKHRAQANFYAHALGSDHGYVLYASRDNPKKRKAFRVAYDPGSLMAQVQEFRTAVHMADYSSGWRAPLDRFFGNKSGTRDQTNRNYLHGLPRTERTENNSYVGSRSLPRN